KEIVLFFSFFRSRRSMDIHPPPLLVNIAVISKKPSSFSWKFTFFRQNRKIICNHFQDLIQVAGKDLENRKIRVFQSAAYSFLSFSAQIKHLIFLIP
ncbi:hypothetical protein, partial [Holdemania filiformis]|uniref:hypothetical protein n=1 Tax=Holdemania filiformis TaxID=61171 RepID=UPI002430BDEE